MRGLHVRSVSRTISLTIVRVFITSFILWMMAKQIGNKMNRYATVLTSHEPNSRQSPCCDIYDEKCFAFPKLPVALTSSHLVQLTNCHKIQITEQRENNDHKTSSDDGTCELRTGSTFPRITLKFKQQSWCDLESVMFNDCLAEKMLDNLSSVIFTSKGQRAKKLGSRSESTSPFHMNTKITS